MGYKVARIDELQKKLQELPEVNDVEREVTKQEAIRRMADTISLLQERGYSMEKIAEILTTEGLTISVSTLKSYLTRAKKTSRAKSRRKGVAKSGPSPSPEKAKPKASSGSSPAQADTHRADGQQASNTGPSSSPVEATPREAPGSSSAQSNLQRTDGPPAPARSSGFTPRPDSDKI